MTKKLYRYKARCEGDGTMFVTDRDGLNERRFRPGEYYTLEPDGCSFPDAKDFRGFSVSFEYSCR